MSTPHTFSERIEQLDAQFRAVNSAVEFLKNVELETLIELEAALFRGISCHPEVSQKLRKLQEDLKEAIG